MKFITQNGKKEVEIKEASFKDASNLKKSVVKNLKNIGIDINNIGSIEQNLLIDKLIELLINIETSDEFESTVMACLNGCIYDGFYNINENLFNDKPETREDYYEIISKCCEVNLRPFFKSLVSELKQRFRKTEKQDNHEQE